MRLEPSHVTCPKCKFASEHHEQNCPRCGAPLEGLWRQFDEARAPKPVPAQPVPEKKK